MSIQAADTSVQRSIMVEAPIERAFSVFTDGIGTWWNADHHLIDGPLEMVFEPRVGGHVYDRAADGTECHWSRVLAYDPPDRVVFSWDINLQWQIETDPEKTSEIEVRFIADGPKRTRVELEHRNLDRHGDGWESMRDAVGGEGGWSLTHYAEVAGRA
jgi:uncharacterized protein YndB with AHSA1/START domain